LDPIIIFLFEHGELVFCAFAVLVLAIHFLGKSRGIVLLVTPVVIVAGFVFVVLAYAPEPIALTRLAALLMLYGVGLFVILSDLMQWRLAKVLTRWRGEKWTKELDYVYLTCAFR
jgi:predicted exporter